MVGQKPRTSLVDPYKPCLRAASATAASTPAPSTERSPRRASRVSYPIVRKVIEQYRRKTDLTRAPRPPSVRQVTGWICRHPDNLVSRDAEQLCKILNRCPELRSAVELVRSFADMMTHLHGKRIGA